MSTTVAKSFTAVGAGQSISIKHNDSFTYAVSGTFVGTVILQRSITGGAAWETVLSATASASGTILVRTPDQGQAWYRFSCSAYTSGTIVTSLADATSDIYLVENEDGDDVFAITEDGIRVKNITVTGTQTITGTTTYSGQVLFADGTVGAPSISNDGDADTGFFFPAANVVAGVAAGAEVFRADAVGVKIGTTAIIFSTTEKLSVMSTQTALTASTQAIAASTQLTSTSANAQAMQGMLIQAERVSSLTVTDTGRIAGIVARARIDIASTQTFNAPSVLSAIHILSLSKPSAGTVSGNYNALSFESDSTAVSGRKSLIFAPLPSGGTNNAVLSDSNAYTGDYMIFQSGTAPSVFGGYVQIGNQADPGAATDSVRLGSIDLSPGNATLALRTETAVVSEVVVSDRTLSVNVNGTTYKICLKV